MNATLAPASAVSVPATKPAPKPLPAQAPKRLPPYHVVLLDDDDHTYEYVIGMLQKLFGTPPECGFVMARQVDTRGKAIIDTTSLERAELKRDQIHAFGRDWRIARCEGSMRCVILPAE